MNSYTKSQFEILKTGKAIDFSEAEISGVDYCDEDGIELMTEVLFKSTTGKRYCLTIEIHNFESGSKYYYIKSAYNMDTYKEVSVNRTEKMINTIYEKAFEIHIATKRAEKNEEKAQAEPQESTESFVTDFAELPQGAKLTRVEFSAKSKFAPQVLNVVKLTKGATDIFETKCESGFFCLLFVDAHRVSFFHSTGSGAYIQEEIKTGAYKMFYELPEQGAQEPVKSDEEQTQEAPEAQAEPVLSLETVTDLIAKAEKVSEIEQDNNETRILIQHNEQKIMIQVELCDNEAIIKNSFNVTLSEDITTEELLTIIEAFLASPEELDDRAEIVVTITEIDEIESLVEITVNDESKERVRVCKDDFSKGNRANRFYLSDDILCEMFESLEECVEIIKKRLSKVMLAQAYTLKTINKKALSVSMTIDSDKVNVVALDEQGETQLKKYLAYKCNNYNVKGFAKENPQSLRILKLSDSPVTGAKQAPQAIISQESAQDKAQEEKVDERPVFNYLKTSIVMILARDVRDEHITQEQSDNIKEALIFAQSSQKYCLDRLLNYSFLLPDSDSFLREFAVYAFSSTREPQDYVKINVEKTGELKTIEIYLRGFKDSRHYQA